MPKAGVLIGFLKALEFTTLMRRIAADIGADAAAIEPVPIEIKVWPPEGADAAVPAQAEAPASRQAGRGVFGTSGMTPEEAVEQLRRLVRAKFDPARPTKRSSSAPHSTAGSPRHASRGSSPSTLKRPSPIPCRPISSASRFAVAPGHACYIPLGHRQRRRPDFGAEPVAARLGEPEAIAR